MTYVSAEAGTGGTFMRSDIAVSFLDEEGQIVKRSPLPKILIPHPDFAIGIAGDDPVGGLVNLLEMWDECSSADELMTAIEEDGDGRREYLLLAIDGQIFKYANRSWAEPRAFGWIGSQEAKQLHDPDPFDSNVATEDEATKRASANWARERGFTEEHIEHVLSGKAAELIGPEMAQLNAMRAAGPEVSSFMIEARPVNGQFKFVRQSIVQVFGSPVLKTADHLLRALFGDGMSVSHYTYSATAEFPAKLAIEFLGARLTFLPCRNRGYSHQIEFLDSEEQEMLILN